MSFYLDDKAKRCVYYFLLTGFICGVVIFCVRLYDPKGMNLILMRFNRWLIVSIACASVIAFLGVLLFLREHKNFYIPLVLKGVLMILALSSLTPPILQFTREFIYFGEAGISTNALLRFSGFILGVSLSVVIFFAAYQVFKALNNFKQRKIFLSASILIFACEYFCAALGALNRLRIIRANDFVFEIMIFDSNNPNFFIYAQVVLIVIMLIFVIATHLKPIGEFANRALLRKEKAYLRDCRRWSVGLFIFAGLAVFILTVLHYYDTKPPAEVQPENYLLENDVINIPLTQVSDGHLHKFDFKTPNGFDVRFLIVKKPAGNSYGVGLDACEICGIAGYYERGEEVICRRCDVVMNKNTIGFKGGCNPIPFEYQVHDQKIFINVNELIKHERRFKN